MNGTYTQCEDLTELEAEIRAHTRRGCAYSRIKRARAALEGTGDLVTQIGSCATNGQHSGYCLFVARRGFHVWLVRYDGASGSSNAPWSYVLALRRPWNGSLSYAAARRAARTAREAA